jgi:biotin transport system substrate-specific component
MTMDRALGALNVRVGGAVFERLTLSVFFLFATVLGAFVEIPLPFTPVPVTLQTLAVLAGAAWLGSGWSMGVQGLYLGAGAVGVSVFAGAAMGAAHLVGPTAGYLWAFLPVSLLVGSLWPRASRAGAWARVGLMASGSLCILAIGASWLAFLLHLDLRLALIMGVLPFLPGEALKVALAAAAGPSRERC